MKGDEQAPPRGGAVLVVYSVASTFLFDRVLCGDDEERQLNRHRLARDGYGILLHRFQQRGLCLGRGPVDLVSEKQVGEDRSSYETEGAIARCDIGLQDLASGDV